MKKLFIISLVAVFAMILLMTQSFAQSDTINGLTISDNFELQMSSNSFGEFRNEDDDEGDEHPGAHENDDDDDDGHEGEHE